jgi:putative addiction module killer protein
LEPTPQELQYTNEFAKWEDRLRGDLRGVVRVRLLRVEKGLFGDSHSVGEGVSELVFDDGPGTRVYFGRSGNNVVLLSGGNKRTQSKDIAKAHKMWR